MTMEACTCEMNADFQAVAAFLSRTEVMRRDTDNILAALNTAVAHKR